MTPFRALDRGARIALCLCASGAMAQAPVPSPGSAEPPSVIESTPPARPVASGDPRPVAREGQRDEPVPGTVPEPDGYHGEPYRSPVPATLRGAEVVGDAGARALWLAGIPFLDLLPTPVRPANLPADTIWRDPPHETIPGAFWLANMGYDALDPAAERAFFVTLEAISGDRLEAPMVFFCKQDCWMSWNAAKRAVERGYTRVFWYPAGTDGWTASGGALESAHPYAAPVP